MHFNTIKILVTVLFLFLLVSAAASEAGQKSRSFTNEDLEKYGSTPSPPARPAEATDSQAEEISPKPVEHPLKKYVIPYSGGSRRIIIPVTFNGRITANMLLDTGAPGMHISNNLARELGLLDDKESNLWVTIGGIGGSVPAIFTIMDSIRVGEAENRFIPTFISPSISSEFDGLIGMDFMADYEVKIDNQKQVVIFEELPESSSLPAGHDERWWKATFSQFKSLRLTWERYREQIFKRESFTEREKELRMFVDRQYRKANDLYDKLSVYASEHSVPHEWR
ncbi:MAG: hypothetical protein C4538_03340 [Nitrospiraceae bacterium]|nr:MAG: hypothetical protein C4538_03340 [Nitrospiraceae bacterium]